MNDIIAELLVNLGFDLSTKRATLCVQKQPKFLSLPTHFALRNSSQTLDTHASPPRRAARLYNIDVPRREMPV